ncbi:hypothetical protein LCGC14_2175910 [marine sediment metagenome]|uniref:DUF7352 domain-containing protein n=1 Tax=marine sediment metagenome TaxID=412755 RepID=A0A0F9DNS4_9ZZZZ
MSEKTIYKYGIGIQDLVHLSLPVDSKILTFQAQGMGIYIWVLHDVAPLKRELRAFRIYGTGHQISESEKLDYIGTTQVAGFVWHLFEESIDV